MLSDAKIKTLKPREKMYRLLDAERLYIEVRPSGKKIWRFRYVLNGKEGSVSFGEYPTISLHQARQLKCDAQSKLAKQLNPSEEKKKEKVISVSETVFKDIAKEYAEEHLSSCSKRYVDHFHTSMKKDIFKVIGNKEINSVTSADVLTIMRNTVKRVKRQKNYGTGEVTAIQNRKYIGAVMRYAISTLRAQYDPTQAVANVIQRPSIQHARPLSKDELKMLRNKLETYGGSTTVKNAGLCMLYSMLRTIEVRRMKWSFVDFDERLITFPVATKDQERTTKKNRIHVVPMSEQIYQILKEQMQINPNQEFVFSAVYKVGMLSATTLNRMLQFMEMKNVSAHDFRATASTLLNEKGYSQDWIEKQLAHADDNKTRASYNHAQYLDDRSKMLQDWADIIDGLK